MALQFVKAKKQETWALAALRGPMNAGKTATMLRMLEAWAKALDGEYCVIDSEHGRASKFVGWENPDGGRIREFAVLNLEDNYGPTAYAEAIELAVKSGFVAVGIDSISHEWIGKGGVLEQVEERGDMEKGGKFKAWAHGSKEHTRFIEALMKSKIHKVATMRMEMAYEIVDEGGKKKVQTLGLQTVQRTGKTDINYEFDIVAELDEAHVITIVKQPPTPIFKGYTEREPGAKFAMLYLDWLRKDAETIEQQAARMKEAKAELIAALKKDILAVADEIKPLVEKDWWEKKGEPFFKSRGDDEALLRGCLDGLKRKIAELTVKPVDMQAALAQLDSTK